MPGEPVPADVIVVYGGNLERTAYGVELYRRGLAPELWHTGYAQTYPQIRARLEDAGIHPNAFTYLVSTSTWTDSTALAQAAHARNIRSILLVTDWWHSRRALCAARRNLAGTGIVVTFAPSPSPAGPANWWHNPGLRQLVPAELAKHMAYLLRYGQWPWAC